MRCTTNRILILWFLIYFNNQQVWSDQVISLKLHYMKNSTFNSLIYYIYIHILYIFIDHQVWLEDVVSLHGFTPCKAEQPLQGMDLQEKDEKHTGKFLARTQSWKVSVKSFRSQVKVRHSSGKVFQSLALWRKETVDVDVFITSRNNDRKSWNTLE